MGLLLKWLTVLLFPLTCAARQKRTDTLHSKHSRIKCNIAIVPLPSSIQCNETSLSYAQLDPAQFNIRLGKDSKSRSSQVLTAAISSYGKLIFDQPSLNSRGIVSPELVYGTDDDIEQVSSTEKLDVAILNELVIEVESDFHTETKRLDDDESYSLYIGKMGGRTSALVKSKTIWGALYGLESFSQMVSDSYTIQNIPMNIIDTPRYPWRGLLLDTSNHFINRNHLLRLIDAMAACKLNTLHWHIVDSYSFPWHSESYPQLANSGAWAENAVYGYKTIEELRVYANSKGVRLIAEIDMPGHAYSWGLSDSFRKVTTKCPKYVDELGHIDDVPLDPSKAETFSLVEGLLEEISRLFPDDYIHIGGDEVKYGCWDESKDIVNFMREIGISGNYRELEEYFYHRIQNILTKLKRKAVAWEEPFFNSSGGTNGAHGAWIGSRALPKETTIIEIWTGADYMEEAMQQGYDAILAYGFYLDRQNPVDGLSSWYFSDTWAQMYTVEPEPLLPTTYNRRGKSDRGRALGGEVSMWTEMVDESNIESSIWPRAAAVAERLWSKRQVKDPALAAPRLSHWRCRLVQRYGIRAGPIWSDSCSAVEQKFGTSLHL